MGRLRELYNGLKAVSIMSIESDILKILRDHENEVVDFNTLQLMGGKDSKGNNIKPEYTPFTVRVKKYKNQPHDRVTLKDEGDFHRSFFIKADKFPVIFSATDWKTDKLKEKYGDEIFGLAKSNIEELNQGYIKEAVQNLFRRLLLL